MISRLKILENNLTNLETKIQGRQMIYRKDDRKLLINLPKSEYFWFECDIFREFRRFLAVSALVLAVHIRHNVPNGLRIKSYGH